MITITCDRCDDPFDVADAEAGNKAACPKCGDINRVPGARAENAPGGGSGSVAGEGDVKKKDRAEAEGYPPDSGPEQRVLLVRRCWARSRPLKFAGASLLMLAGPAGLIWALVSAHEPWTRWLWLVPFLLGAAALAWWGVERLTAAIEITNKRTVQKTGLFSRSSSEVVHDNIRNVQVDQNVWQRVWKVGRLGISSSGQDGVEIQINHLPNPDRIRKVIDLYRDEL
ncbi:MAG: PH domain-containing protein [Planctomycetota bacterium]